MSHSWHSLHAGPKAKSPGMSHIAVYAEVFGSAPALTLHRASL